MDNNPKNENIKDISSNSTKEQVSSFLSSKFKISKDIGKKIIKEDISGDIIFNLEENELKKLGLKLGPVIKIRKYLAENAANFKEKEVEEKIDDSTSAEEVNNFMEKYIGYKGDLKLDGNQFLNLKEKDISQMKLNLGQRKKLEKYIKYFNSKKSQKKEEIKKEDKDKIKNKEKEEEKGGKTEDKKEEEGKEEKVEDKKEDNKNKNENGKDVKKINEDKIEDLNTITNAKEVKEEKVEKEDENKEKEENEEKKGEKNGIPDIKKDKEEGEVGEKMEENQSGEAERKEDEKEEKKEPEKKYPKILYQKLDSEIKPLDQESKNNFFFIISIKEDYFIHSNLSTYEEISDEENIDHPYLLLMNEEIISLSQDKKRIILVQVPFQEKIKKLTINLLLNKKDIVDDINEANQNEENQEEEKKEKDEKNDNIKEYKCQIKLDENLKNYFLFNSLNFENSKDFLINEDINYLFTHFFNYFYNEEKNKNEKYKIGLINSLINIISGSTLNIFLESNNLFRLLSLSLEYNIPIKNIGLIELCIETNEYKHTLDKEWILTWDKIDKLFLLFDKHNLENAKKILPPIFVKLYSSFIEYRIYLNDLLKSKHSKIFMRDILKSLLRDEIKFGDLNINDKKQINKLKRDFLEVAKSKEEINYINKLSKGLTTYLTFIKENYDLIVNILEKNAKKNKSNEANYLLNLPFPTQDDDIDKIYEILLIILKKTKTILKYDELFNQLVNFAGNDSLDEFCKLKKFIEPLKEYFQKDTVENYYQKIHQKGMNLILNNQMKVEEILNFIYTQDVYYYDDKYTKHANRDPSIFEHIPITETRLLEGQHRVMDINSDYQLNINLLKERKIWELFKESSKKTLNAFYQLFINQMLNARDFQNLFNLFPFSKINKDVVLLINKKISEIIYTCFSEFGYINPKDKQLFEIFENILVLNNKNQLDPIDAIKLIQLSFPYDFTSNYFFYLLQSDKTKNVIPKIKNFIINYFIEEHKKGNTNIDSLIFLLQVAPDDSFRIELLNQMDNFIMTENDFYQVGENKKFILFRLFSEKFPDLIKKNKIGGKYLVETVKLKSKIYGDLTAGNVKYETIEYLMENEKNFLNKICVITDFNKKKGENVLNDVKGFLKKCSVKFNVFDKILEFYTTFYNDSKRELIRIIKDNLKLVKQKTIKEVINLELKKFVINENFNLDECVKESNKLKYKYSLFFMLIYREKYDSEHLEKTEDEIFNTTIEAMRNAFIKIINQKETKEPFFEINYVEIILRIIQNTNNNIKEELIFVADELKDINKDNYIKNNLLTDLIHFSFKNKIENLIHGIIYFIETFNKIKEVPTTNYFTVMDAELKKIANKSVTAEEIKQSIDLLNKYGYNVIKETTSLMEFYELLLGKEEAITFIKKIKDSQLEIRNLNEFIDEQENSQLTTNDIDNLLAIYNFFNALIENQKISSDLELIDIFQKSFNNEKNLMIKMKEYLKCYGEIIQLYKLYDQNPEVTVQKVNKILKTSFVDFYKDPKTSLFTFKIRYYNQKNAIQDVDISELSELRYKIYMSSTGTNILTEEKKDVRSKEIITNKFVSLIDNINQLNSTLNSLIKSGYPFIIKFSLKIEDAEAFSENDKSKNLEKLIEEYKSEEKKFKKIIKNGYKTKPLLRLFYAYQFIQLYEQIIKFQDKENSPSEPDKNILWLVNYMTLNQIYDFDVDYKYNDKLDCISNINCYLELLLKANNTTLDQIYNTNKVLFDVQLTPGLYRRIKDKHGNYSDLTVDLINLYSNLTGNLPIANTLLLCNEETSIEEIKAFLYRAIYNDKPILFVMSNMEYLSLSVTQSFLRTLRKLYKLKNKNIKSYLIFFYEKQDSGLSRDLEKLIPDKNILNKNYMNNPAKRNQRLDEIIVYSSSFSGYGKTTEIIYHVKDKSGDYAYLPIGGTFNRDYVIKNLKNLKLEVQNCKYIYLHLDLSDTDKDDLMTEILFKLIILKYLDSNEEIFYLGYDINIIIEIPQGFINFEEKFRMLTLFKKEFIDSLRPLRLEPNVAYMFQSPISIVAEVLILYEENKIGKKNIDLEMPIDRDDIEKYENIINKYFNVENQNYYQKMNFIKILSLQFKKFTQNYFLNYDNAFLNGIHEMIKIARVQVIENFIALTKVFTRSPYDQLLIKRQTDSVNIYNKYDQSAAIERAINELENQKQEIFSFDDIKPSLVFFNRDGMSLSIISNADENDKDYKELQKLWNSNNPNPRKLNPLTDYKKMSHDEFLDEIKKLFSLDSISKEQLKQICIKAGNYIFVCDNFIKIVRILLNIEAKIPVILMGETGVGKTKILEMISTLYGKGKLNWKKLEIHAGTTDEDIVAFIEKSIQEDNAENKDKNLTWVFFDEINTCNSLGLITEIMCKHTYLGKKINDNFVFLGACNPYRVLNKKMRESGLVYYNTKDKNKLNNLVYSVNPLPHSLLNFVFDFGSLRPEDERKYIHNTIVSIIESIMENNIIKNISNPELEELIEKIIEGIVRCHKFIREKYDKSSVSMREIRRFGIFFEYFIKYFSNMNYSDYKKMFLSLNMTLYLCYYLRLNDKMYRKELAEQLNILYPKSSFLSVPEYEIKRITKEMTIEKGKGIALNRALRENLFTCFTCIINNVPLIIVGKPGTGKSLSFQILYNSMKGEYSESKLFKDKGKLYRYYYQGSETSTAEGIKQVFLKALALKESQESNEEKDIIPLVFFDEMGLAERSSNNPLKVMHFLLEKDTKDSVPFLGISNWKLDAAKINRALGLTITDYDIQDLEETAISIAEALDEPLTHKFNDFFKTLARTYNKFIIEQGKSKENKDFHGNRDFYNLIKSAMRELIIRKNDINKNERNILTQVGLLSLERNFGGLEDSIPTIKGIFKDEFKHKFDENVKLDEDINVLDVIERNIKDPNSRYLMLISDGNDASEILKYLLNNLKKKYVELVGSKYKSDMKSGRYSEEILNKIKYIMETDDILILKDLDVIYPSLYDLFNQNFTIMGNKQFARIAFEYAKISSEVNHNFHAIVLVNNIQIQNLKLDPPFLNRFEKHIVSFKMLLDAEDISIAQKLSTYINLIATYNNNKKLKLDLEKLLINCKQHDIEGLIFKIKKDNPNILKQKGTIEYESLMIKEVFNKIVPTFCQDIIVSLKYSKISNKYSQLNEIVFDIYKKSVYNNFASFFQKINSQKNIIYTFSKANENIFEDNQSIKNIYGIFNKQSSVIENIDSIKSESELLYILKQISSNPNKNILILRFGENELNKVNSINFAINNYRKDNKNFDKKLIMFIIHKKRQLKNDKSKTKIKKSVIPDLIPFINEEFCQVFIDNLQGNKNMDLFKVVSQQTEQLTLEYLRESNLIDSKIYTILNYIKCTLLFETEKINNNNYINVIAEKIIKNQKLKELLKKNIEQQGKNLSGIIDDIYVSDILEVNDIDFFEVLNSKLSNYLSLCLLKIIFSGLKENILNEILMNDNLELFTQNNYFNNIITSFFNSIEFKYSAKIGININKVTIYNGLQIPKSKFYLDKIIKYFNDTNCQRYIENENLLRKNYQDPEKIGDVMKIYQEENKAIENNVFVELNSHEFFKEIYNQANDEMKKILREDYLKYYVTKIIEKRQINDYKKNESILNILILILKIKLVEENSVKYFNFHNDIEELVKIILFTQGYKDDISNLIEIILDISAYFNIEGKIIDILGQNIIKYEISNRNKRYTKKVNLCFFNIIESFIRGMLLYSIELLKKDNYKFYDYFFNFIQIEANLQKINKKYNLFSKGIYNLISLIKIYDSFKINQGEFEKNYEIIVKNLLKQSQLLYEENYQNLYDEISGLNKIISQSFKEMNDEYANLLFFLFRQQYQNINNEKIKIKLIQDIFANNSLIKKSYIFLVDTMKDVKPEIFDKNDRDKNNEETLVRNFLNIYNNPKLNNYKELYKFFNTINSVHFNELLLYFFENQCQSYFTDILKMYDNKFSEKCCEMLLLKTSLLYLKKCFQYLYENKNKNENNILKIYAIAYIKTYFYYYVEINYNHFDKCNWEEINKLLIDKNENNKYIVNMRNIFIFRLYFKKFDNFEQFTKFEFDQKNIPIYKDIYDILKKEDSESGKYIFKNSFINANNFNKLADFIQIINVFILDNSQKIDFNFDEINNNFDVFYCCLVNKMISYLYGNNKNHIAEKMKYLYDSTIDKINLGEEGKILYKYLFNNDLLQNKIIKKIDDEKFNQDDFEILLYILRIIFNTQINKSDNFYNNVLKKNTSKFIADNYIPGSFPFMNEFIKSYNYLSSKFPAKELMGYYICKDCGYVYEIRPCTFPVHEYHCPYNHVIGGVNHILSKKDLRIFNDDKDMNEFCRNRNQSYINSFNAMSFANFKKNYVDQYLLHKEKGILENFAIEDFEKNSPVRELNNITYRFLSLILYSYLLGSYILEHLTADEMRKYLVDNLFPHSLFGIVKKNWEILDKELKGIGYENINIFLNMNFNEIINLINNLKSVDSSEKLDNFEKSFDKFILDNINNKDKVQKINNEYNNLNNKLLNCNPQSIKEIIQCNYPPSKYSQEVYPDIQYYTISKISNMETFINKFNSSEENKKKYALINSLINRGSDLTQNAMKLKSLVSINNLTNLLLNIYSYKISRNDGKAKLLKDEIPNIVQAYNEINPAKPITSDEFIEEYINPFIKSWDLIKKNSVQYKCRVLKDLEKGEKPYEMKIDNRLCDFLVDNGDKEGGMFLAAAYQYLIQSQNSFVDNIISKNNIQGILNSYVAQLEQSINIQDATENEIVNIDDNIYILLNELILNNSLRNIFMKNKNEINYSNYTDIIYDYDNIEEELGKKILPGLKKFNPDKIHFITYLYEGFRGDNTSILVDYNNKYIQKELNENEKESLEQFLESNNNNRFYNEVFSSLQILMNEIIKENYKQNQLIYQIIESKPNCRQMLNIKLVDFLRKEYEFYNDSQLFTVNSLMGIFDYFESLCWKEIKKFIPEDYNLDLDDKFKEHLSNYFLNKQSMINKENFTDALRKLLSRYISGTREEADIKNDVELIYHIAREELWNKAILEIDGFENEIDKIFEGKFRNIIKVGQSMKLYEFLDGDGILDEKLNKNKQKIEPNITDIKNIEEEIKNNTKKEVNEHEEVSTSQKDSKDNNNDEDSDEEIEEDSEEEERDDRDL